MIISTKWLSGTFAKLNASFFILVLQFHIVSQVQTKKVKRGERKALTWRTIFLETRYVE